MGKGTVVEIGKPEGIRDLLTETIREGARQILAVAVKAEVAVFLAANNPPDEPARFVRNGYLPEREIQTGIGNVGVKMPRIRDRSDKADGILFSGPRCQTPDK